MREFFLNLKKAIEIGKCKKTKLILYFVSSLAGVAISIIVPIFSAKLILNISNGIVDELIYSAFLIFIVEVLNNANYYLFNYFTQELYCEAYSNIQLCLGKEILKIDNTCLDTTNSGVLIQRITSDTDMVSSIFNIINYDVMRILTNIGIFVAIIIINKYVFIYLFVTMILLFFFEKKRTNEVNKKEKILKKSNDDLSGNICELVRGVRDLKMLNSENNYISFLTGKINFMRNDRRKKYRTYRIYSFLVGTFHDIIDFGLIILLFILFKNNLIAVSGAIIIYNYSSKVSMFVYSLSDLLDETKNFSLSCSRIFEIIDSKKFTKEEFGKNHIDKINGDFEFKNVAFKYASSNNDILNDLSFKVKANTTVAFVGKSGAGKTTIFSLLCGLYKPYNGNIYIDGVDISSLDKDSIRGNITIISQSPYIFNLSIKDNLKIAKSNITDEEMREACKVACLDDFINSLPNKYDTIVGEGGVLLSGGQKQRLAIARALVQKTEIILFDEATSALDNETQKKIKEAIDNMKSNYTILIIAHRFSTIINSDHILFLSNGRIEAHGTHKQLLESCDDYRKLYESEINKF